MADILTRNISRFLKAERAEEETINKKNAQNPQKDAEAHQLTEDEEIMRMIWGGTYEEYQERCEKVRQQKAEFNEKK